MLSAVQMAQIEMKASKQRLLPSWNVTVNLQQMSSGSAVAPCWYPICISFACILTKQDVKDDVTNWLSEVQRSSLFICEWFLLFMFVQAQEDEALVQ